MQAKEIFFASRKLKRMLLICMLVVAFLFIIIIYGKLSSVVFYLLCFVLAILVFAIKFCTSKLLTNKPALIINHKGIWDNSTALSLGWIEWGQIKIIKVNHQYGILMVVVKDPSYFIRSVPNWFKRTMMLLNWKLDETPIHLNDKLIDITYMELLEEIQKRQDNAASFDDFSEHLVDE